MSLDREVLIRKFKEISGDPARRFGAKIRMVYDELKTQCPDNLSILRFLSASRMDVIKEGIPQIVFLYDAVYSLVFLVTYLRPDELVVSPHPRDEEGLMYSLKWGRLYPEREFTQTVGVEVKDGSLYLVAPADGKDQQKQKLADVPEYRQVVYNFVALSQRTQKTFLAESAQAMLTALNSKMVGNPKDYLPSVWIAEALFKAVSTLSETRFFVAPASTKYHECYVGGLFRHSYAVARSAYKNATAQEARLFDYYEDMRRDLGNSQGTWNYAFFHAPRSPYIKTPDWHRGIYPVIAFVGGLLHDSGKANRYRLNEHKFLAHDTDALFDYLGPEPYLRSDLDSLITFNQIWQDVKKFAEDHFGNWLKSHPSNMAKVEDEHLPDFKLWLTFVHRLLVHVIFYDDGLYPVKGGVMNVDVNQNETPLLTIVQHADKMSSYYESEPGSACAVTFTFDLAEIK